MTISFSGEQLHFLYQIHQNVAKQLGIKDFEWKSMAELNQEIQGLNPQVAEMIADFGAAYKSWTNINDQIGHSGTSGNLTEIQLKALSDAIDLRDATRKSLISKLFAH